MSLKVTYVDVPGRGYPIRTALRIAGIDFIDEKVSFQELKAAKAEKGYTDAFPLGSVPTLTLPDGRVITQSLAIGRYAGKLANLYPSDPVQALLVDELLDTVQDILNGLPQHADTDTKKTLREEYANGKLKVFFNFLSTKLAASSGPYTLGETLVLSDIFVYWVLKGYRKGNFDFIPTDYDSAWPNLGQFIATMESNPSFFPYVIV
jgi:glutathione S-transferase